MIHTPLEVFARLLSGNTVFPEFGRRHAELAFEAAAEVGGFQETDLRGNIGYISPALFQELGGAFQAQYADKFRRRLNRSRSLRRAASRL